MTNREIGIAMGVLMNAHKITRQQAFDLLRIVSQHTHRKLYEIARDVADTGALDLPAERQRAAFSRGKPQPH
jgi:AmiR/NasT family two-component response regulator